MLSSLLAKYKGTHARIVENLAYEVRRANSDSEAVIIYRNTTGSLHMDDISYFDIFPLLPGDKTKCVVPASYVKRVSKIGDK